MTPRLSVVIPAYNNENYIAETLESVLNQSYNDFDVVIADHSSVDSTAEIIGTFAGDKRLRILDPTPTGGGAQANWNRVSQAASGDYLKLVCGDDLLAPSCLEKQMAALDKNPSAVLVSSKRDLVDAAGKVFVKSRGLQGIAGKVSGAEAIKATVRAGTNIFGEPACSTIKRSVLADIGWWDNTHPYLIDEATLAKVCAYGDVVALSESLASFRVSASQWSVRLARQQSAQAQAFHRQMRKEHPDFITNFDVSRGNIAAVAMSYLRRLAYLRLGRRMNHEGAVESTT